MRFGVAAIRTWAAKPLELSSETSSQAARDETFAERLRRKQGEGDKSADIKWQSGPFSIFTHIADNESFQNFILMVICLNAVWIGVDMEMKQDDQQYIWFDSFEVFGVVENLFCLAFTFELVVRFFQYKFPPWHFFTDKDMWHWNIFDLTLVGMMIFEQWIIVSPLAPFDVAKLRAEGEGDGGGMSALSSFRLLRLLRISRMVRIIRMFPELGIMLKSMGAATRGVLSTLLLATGLIYVYSVILTQWGKTHPEGAMRTRFGSFGQTFMILIQVTVGNDAYTQIRWVFEVDQKYGSHNGILLMSFVLLSTFTILNMLIGVIVEIVQDTQRKEKNTILMGKLVEVFTQIDKDGSGKLDKQEMRQGIKKLIEIGVDKKHIMMAMDFLDDEQETDLSDFIALMEKLNGPIEADDIVEVSCNIRQLCKHFSLESMAHVRAMGFEEEEFVDDPYKAKLLGLDKLDPADCAPLGPNDSVGTASSVASSVASSASTGSVASSVASSATSYTTKDGIRVNGRGAPDKDDCDKLSIGSTYSTFKKQGESLGLGDPDLQWTTGFAQYFCNSEKFGAFILGVICVNGLWISVEIECNDTDAFNCSQGGKGDVIWGLDFWQVVENIFCVIFTFEILVRIFAYKRIKFFFLDRSMRVWNIFDTILVSLMIFENWIVLFMDTGGSDLSMFSIFRLLRLLRISRIIRSSPELSIMVKALAAAGRSVGSTMLLLVGFIYVFAIIMTQWATTNAATDPYIEGQEWHTSGHDARTGLFGTIFLSMLTGIQLIVCDNAMSICRHVMNRSGMYGTICMVFQYGGAFTLLNMLIGVICEIVSETKSKEIERMRMEKIKKVFKDFDDDRSGTISKEEFHQKKHLVLPFGIDDETCMRAFDLVDKDGNGELSPADFMTLCFKLTQQPESIDIQTCKWNLLQVARHLRVADTTTKPRKAKQAVKMKEIRRSRTELAQAIGYQSIWEGEEPEPEEEKKSKSSKKSKRSKSKE